MLAAALFMAVPASAECVTVAMSTARVLVAVPDAEARMVRDPGAIQWLVELYNTRGDTSITIPGADFVIVYQVHRLQTVVVVFFAGGCARASLQVWKWKLRQHVPAEYSVEA